MMVSINSDDCHLSTKTCTSRLLTVSRCLSRSSGLTSYQSYISEETAITFLEAIKDSTGDSATCFATCSTFGNNSLSGNTSFRNPSWCASWALSFFPKIRTSLALAGPYNKRSV
jgi:hypothetical protein